MGFYFLAINKRNCQKWTVLNSNVFKVPGTRISGEQKYGSSEIWVSFLRHGIGYAAGIGEWA